MQQAAQSESNKLEEAAACMSDDDCEPGVKCDENNKCEDPAIEAKAVSVDEDLLEELAETLTMDYIDQPSGGFANGQMKPTNAFHDTQMVRDIAFAIEEYGEEQKEKNDKLQKENKQFKRKNLQLKKEFNFVVTNNKKLIESVKLIIVEKSEP